MEVVYNNIPLQVCHSARFQQRAVYGEDGTDYLFTHVLLEVDCIFNPAATATNQVQGGLGDDPATTMTAIRHALMQPRRRLTIRNGGLPLVISPERAVVVLGGNGTSQNFIVDCKNGPHPIACNVLEFHGTKTFKVRYVIETWINECPQPASPLVSHRWDMTHDVDWKEYTTKTINGVAVFRSDLLAAAGQTPDNFRNVLAHPLEAGFEREVRYGLSEDGLRFRYQITDRETTLRINPYVKIKRIAGRYRRKLEWTSTLPSQSHSMIFQAWGRRTTPRHRLVAACIYACFIAYQFPTAQNLLAFPAVSAELTVDVVDKYAQLEVLFRTSGFFNLGTMISGTALFQPLNLSDWPEDVGILATLNGNSATGPSRSGGTRGSSYLGSILAQSLTPECSKPAQPVTPARFADVIDY